MGPYGISRTKRLKLCRVQKVSFRHRIQVTSSIKYGVNPVKTQQITGRVTLQSAHHRFLNVPCKNTATAQSLLIHIGLESPFSRAVAQATQFAPSTASQLSVSSSVPWLILI